MKIISGGKKDYYDYLSGIYGIDEDVVYDRRDGFVFKRYNDGQHYFINEILGDDSKRVFVKQYQFINGKGSYVLIPKGSVFHVVIEIGKVHYLFIIERYLDDNDKLCLEPKLIKKEKIKEKKSEAPISVIPVDCYSYRMDYEIRKYFVEREIKNPVFNNTWVTSFIPADEIYNEVYNYLISIKEPNIVDNRSDIQKLESKGFDKKESFRNPIIKAKSVKHGKKIKSKV